MSIRSTIMKVLRSKTTMAAGEETGAKVVPFGSRQTRKTRRGEKKRKQPPKGRRYDIVDRLHRTPWAPWTWTDEINTFHSVKLGKNRYMRRTDGVWYKPMRTGEWTSMLSPPKGGEIAYRIGQATRAVVGTGIVGAGAAGINEMRRK